MPVYVVCYDLINATSAQYEEIAEAIKDCGQLSWRFQDSAFFVSTGIELGQLRDRLEAHLNSRDKLYIGQLEGSAAWSGYDPQEGGWIRQFQEMAQQYQRSRAGFRSVF